MSELLHKIGSALKLPRFELPDRIHNRLKYVKYFILVILIAGYLIDPIMGEKMAEIEPFKTTFFVNPLLRAWPFLVWWAFLAILSIFTWRPFCGYLCPLGAAFALGSSVRLSPPQRINFCSKCSICRKGCEPRAIRKDGSIDPRECLNCMECESNYRDAKTCPPLVGLGRKENLTIEMKQRLERDREKLNYGLFK